MKPVKQLLSLAVITATLSACVSAPHSRPAPAPVKPTVPVVTAPPVVQPPVTEPRISLPPEAAPQPPAPKPPATVKTPSAAVDESQARALLQQLLPAGIKDRSGWRNDILTAFTGLKIPYEAQYFCAAIAIIEQESSWQADPGVPNLDKIVWKEIEKRAAKYHLPMLAVKTAFLKTSPDGRSYKKRIDALKTEKQMNDLFEDMAADAHALKLPLSLKNPIRTGGPM